MKRIFLTGMCLLLVGVMMLNLAGCDGIKSQNLMKNITPQSVEKVDDLSVGNIAMTDFAVRLFKECETSGQNTLISPLSVMYALAMTANGASGETLSQMEDALGMPIDQLNEYLYTYKNSLPQGEKYTLNLANSIWFNDTENFKVNQDFLQTNANYYGVDVYKAEFNKRAVKDINNWVNLKTNEMIPEIIDNIDSNDMMFLINALMFEADWEYEYRYQNIKDDVFICEDGTSQNVVMMNSNEYHYISDENATGFIKNYADEKYAFVALLPNLDKTVSEYISTLDGKRLNQILSNATDERIRCGLPKFEYDYDISMVEPLKSIGIKDAFDENNANLSKLGHHALGDLLIGDVQHKTTISVNEKGTSAGAASLAKIIVRSGLYAEKVVYLNRPFVYMIIDCQNNVPIFMGTVMSVN